ncbi:MAG: hypothetical protein E6G54_01645 [Actinobacteria bacterium]|nr:MAG: hypothetical protein E6G54_01645 [Actinomycetota bacterium]
MPNVERFNLTPVKSTALLQPDAIDLRREGAVGDRRFLFVRATGERLSGETKAPLMNIRSSYDVAQEHLTLTFPDGATAEGRIRVVRRVPHGEAVRSGSSGPPGGSALHGSDPNGHPRRQARAAPRRRARVRRRHRPGLDRVARLGRRPREPRRRRPARLAPLPDADRDRGRRAVRGRHVGGTAHPGR